MRVTAISSVSATFVLVLVVPFVLGLVVVASPAYAVSCPGTPQFDFLLNEWQPTGAFAGFRAPVVLRKTGSICSPDGHTDSWMGVYGDAGIAQIGWTHDASAGYCRFRQWYTDTIDNDPVLERCNVDLDGAERLFKVSEWFNPDTHQYFYGIYDCAASDWSTCTLLDGGPRIDEILATVGGAAAESNFGRAACTNELMGSSGQRVRFGEEASDPIKGQLTYAGSWGVRSLQYSPGNCGHYVSAGTNAHTDQTFRTYDDRN